MSVNTSTGMDVWDWFEMMKMNFETAAQIHDRPTMDAVLDTLYNNGFKKEADTLIQEYIDTMDAREHRFYPVTE